MPALLPAITSFSGEKSLGSSSSVASPQLSRDTNTHSSCDHWQRSWQLFRAFQLTGGSCTPPLLCSFAVSLSLKPPIPLDAKTEAKLDKSSFIIISFCHLFRVLLLKEAGSPPALLLTLLEKPLSMCFAIVISCFISELRLFLKNFLPLITRTSWNLSSFVSCLFNCIDFFQCLPVFFPTGLHSLLYIFLEAPAD